MVQVESIFKIIFWAVPAFMRVLPVIASGPVKVYSNLMVDVKSSNKKLEERARRILMEATNCDRQTAIDTLAITQGKVKPAILMLLANISYEEALSSLNNNEGFISKSLNSMKK